MFPTLASVLAVFGALVALEMVSRAVASIHGRAQPVAKSAGYPLFPSKHFTIGLYGGSCAAGYLAEVDLADFLNTSGLRINGKPIYCTKLARPGWPLVGGQGQIAVDLATRFDLTIIWEGNNDYLALNPRVQGNEEQVRHYFLSGQRKLLRVTTLKSRVLHKIQRLYSSALIVKLATRTSETLRVKFSKKPPRGLRGTSETEASNSWFTNLDSITDSPIVELDAKKKVEQNYLEQVLRIAGAVSEAGKRMMVLTMPNNDFWPPIQSKVASADRAMIEETVIICMARLQESEKADFQTIIDQCSRVCQITSEPPSAILFLLGVASLRLGKISDAKRFLDMTFQFDYGVMLGRSNLRARTILLEGIDRNPDIDACDIAEEFQSFLGDPAFYELLFSDVQHPSTLGYWMAFRKLVKALSAHRYELDLPEALSREASDPCKDALDFTRKLTASSNAIKTKRSSVTYGRMAWIVGAYRLHSWPGELSRRAIQAFEEWHALEPNTESVIVEFWRGMCLLCTDPAGAVAAFERARGLDERAYMELMHTPSDTGAPYGSIVANYLPCDMKERALQSSDGEGRI